MKILVPGVGFSKFFSGLQMISKERRRGGVMGFSKNGWKWWNLKREKSLYIFKYLLDTKVIWKWNKLENVTILEVETSWKWNKPKRQHKQFKTLFHFQACCTLMFKPYFFLITGLTSKTHFTIPCLKSPPIHPIFFFRVKKVQESKKKNFVIEFTASKSFPRKTK